MLRDMSASNSVDTSVGSITASVGVNCSSNSVGAMFGTMNGLMPNNGSSTDESNQLHDQTCGTPNGMKNLLVPPVAQSNVTTNGSTSGSVIDNSNGHVVIILFYILFRKGLFLHNF